MMLHYKDIGLALRDMSRLPNDKSSEQVTNDGVSQRDSADGQPNVLIYGNDLEIRFLLRTILDVWNYDFEEAETVEQAIDLASKKIFDLVLMDTKLKFPDSFAEMRRMRKSDCLKDSPFVLLSGHVQPDVRQSALAAGAADFFVKPINLDLLEQKLKIYISKTDGAHRRF